jgi:hypothetical protein
MPRQQTQNQGKKGRNPGMIAPEDDDNVEAAEDSRDPQAMQGGQRQAQDARRRPEDNIEQVEDEEAEDDEDETDQISQRP